jgi:uncharacterized membrane protein YdjX (TVP38/TMEM64 family)
MSIKEKDKKIIAIITLVLTFIFCGLVTWFIGRPMINFVSQPDLFRDWVNSKGVFGKIAFVGMVFFQVVIALVPGEPLEIGAGYAFGALPGTLLCLMGTFLGSIVVFLLVRKFGIKFVEIFFGEKKIKKLKFLENPKKRDLLIFTVFFLPGTPKDLLTYFAGLTEIKLTTFLAITTIARIPSILTSTLGGNALGTQKYITAIIVFALTLIISGAGLLIYNKISDRKKN